MNHREQNIYPNLPELIKIYKRHLLLFLFSILTLTIIGFLQSRVKEKPRSFYTRIIIPELHEYQVEYDIEIIKRLIQDKVHAAYENNPSIKENYAGIEITDPHSSNPVAKKVLDLTVFLKDSAGLGNFLSTLNSKVSDHEYIAQPKKKAIEYLQTEKAIREKTLSLLGDVEKRDKEKHSSFNEPNPIFLQLELNQQLLSIEKRISNISKKIEIIYGPKETTTNTQSSAVLKTILLGFAGFLATILITIFLAIREKQKYLD